MSRRAAAPAPLTAFVLHRYDWSESSLIVELFTRERGRVVVAAKGAKRPYSQLRPVLLPLQRIVVTLARTGSDDATEVHTLRGAEWGGGPPMPSGEAIFRGFYVNELLVRLLRAQGVPSGTRAAYEAAIETIGNTYERDRVMEEWQRSAGTS